MDGKQACQMMIQVLEIDPHLFRIGQSKIFFRVGIIAQLEEERFKKISQIMMNFQKHCRGWLARKRYQDLNGQAWAVKLIQRNMRAVLVLKNLKWWDVYMLVKPVTQISNFEDKLHQKVEEFRHFQEQTLILEDNMKMIEKQAGVLQLSKNESDEKLRKAMER